MAAPRPVLHTIGFEWLSITEVALPHTAVLSLHVIVVLLGLELPLFLLLLLLNFVLHLKDFGQFELLPRADVHIIFLN